MISPRPFTPPSPRSSLPSPYPLHPTPHFLSSPLPPLGRPSPKADAREAAYRNWFRRQHPFALVSLLLGAFSLTHFGTLFVDEAAGIVLGVVTLRQLARARREAAA